MVTKRRPDLMSVKTNAFMLLMTVRPFLSTKDFHNLKIPQNVNILQLYKSFNYLIHNTLIIANGLGQFFILN